MKHRAKSTFVLLPHVCLSLLVNALGCMANETGVIEFWVVPEIHDSSRLSVGTNCGAGGQGERLDHRAWRILDPATGASLTACTALEPDVVVKIAAIEKVVLLVPEIPRDDHPRVLARLKMQPKDRARLEKLRTENDASFLLVSEAGHAIGIEFMLVPWDEGVGGGGFSSVEEASRAYESLGIRVERMDLPVTRSTGAGAAWCREDEGNSTEEGELMDGKRHGVWKVVAPSGLVVRWKVYEKGRLVFSTGPLICEPLPE